MATTQPPGQVRKRELYEELLSFVGTQDRIEEIKNLYPKDKVSKQRQDRINFCKYISKEWVIRTLTNQTTTNEEKRRFIDLANEEKRRFIDLANGEVCRDKRDIEIYFYFLYFSGILFLFKEEEFKKEFNGGLYELREFFEKKTESNKSLPFNFMSPYVDLVDPNKKDITQYEELKKCLVDDDDNILFDLFDKNLELIMEILLQETSDSSWKGARSNIIKEQIFPDIEDKDIVNGGENIIKSIIQSGIAKLYFVAGREVEHIERLTKALSFDEGYPYNSFALVQTAHILAQLREKLDETFDNEKVLDDDNKKLHDSLRNLIKTADSAVRVRLSRKDPVGTSERLFKKVINLMKYDLEKKQFENGKKEYEDLKVQFRSFSTFVYRILFEAVVGLAYIDFLRGHDSRANDKYTLAQEIIEKHFHSEKLIKDYLTSILLLNSGRNKLDNGSEEDDKQAKDDFEKVLKIYKNASDNIKEELAEIAARAYNNLGIYYLNEADYDNAEKYFKKSIETDDDNNPYARYNLGVLYYKKEDETRALTLFRNAHYIDPNFSEATVALDKLGALKKGSLGSDWYGWWFEKEKQNKGRTRMRRKMVSTGRPITAYVLVGAIIASFAGLAIELSLHHLEGIHRHESNHDWNPYIIVIGISIAILMLPFLNKLKISDIEIELETTGYRPVAPASVDEGIADSYYDALKNRFFFAPFWYPFDIPTQRTSNGRPSKESS